MAGLEQIISQICEEADNQVKEILNQARDKARQISDSQKRQTEEALSKLEKDEQVWEKEYRQRLKSSRDLQKRREILKAKQELVTEVLDKAYERLAKQETEAYFSMIERMIEKIRLTKDASLYLSPEDLERMPKDFKEKVSAIALRQGKSLKVENESRKIDKGFLLVYGGIEENYSLKALFNEKREELQDKVCAVLFPC